MLFDEIVDHCVDGTETIKKDSLIVLNNGGKINRETTKFWEILFHWKYSSTTWEIMKDVKECYPFLLVVYYHQS